MEITVSLDSRFRGNDKKNHGNDTQGDPSGAKTLPFLFRHSERKRRISVFHLFIIVKQTFLSVLFFLFISGFDAHKEVKRGVPSGAKMLPFFFRLSERKRRISVFVFVILECLQTVIPELFYRESSFLFFT